MRADHIIAASAFWAAVLCAAPAALHAQGQAAGRDDSAAAPRLDAIPLAAERSRRPAVPIRTDATPAEEDTIARVGPLKERSASEITPVFPAGLAAPKKLLAPAAPAAPVAPVATPAPADRPDEPAGTVRQAVAVPAPAVEEETLPPPEPATAALAGESAAVPGSEGASVAAVSPASAPQAPPARHIVAAEAWRRALTGINRPSASLAEQSGRLTIVHFWADWCGPCKEELPLVEAFWRDDFPALSERGLRLVTVSNDMRRREAEGVMRQYDLTFPIFLDRMQAINRELAGTRALPLTVLVAEDGAVEILSVGKYDWDPAAFERRLASAEGTS